MTVFYGAVSNRINSGLTPLAGTLNGTVLAYTEIVTYAAQTVSDTIVVANIPKGARILGFLWNTDTSSGSTTLAMGITGTVAKYKAAAAFTALDTPTWVGKAAAMNVALAADEQIFLTLAAATAPGAGSLCITTFYAPN